MFIPELSVLVTAYNCELYISETIVSILSQSFQNFELIIIDNCSNDNTAAIVKSFDDPRIHYIIHEHNSGITASRNEALDRAKGNYISFIDADDVAMPTRFEKQVNYLNSHPETGIVGSSVLIIDEKGKEKGHMKLGAKSDQIPVIMLFHNYFINSAIMFRRSILNGKKYPETLTFGEDYYMWWQLLHGTKGINLPEYLTKYRIHPDSITQQLGDGREDKDRIVYKMIFSDIGLQATDDELNIHLSIKSNKHIFTFKTMNKAFSWLQKISEHAENYSNFDKNSIRPVMRNRWLKVCYKARLNRGLLFYGLFKMLSNYKSFFN